MRSHESITSKKVGLRPDIQTSADQKIVLLAFKETEMVATQKPEQFD